MVTGIGMVEVNVVGTLECGSALETDVKEVLAIFNNSKNPQRKNL